MMRKIVRLGCALDAHRKMMDPEATARLVKDGRIVIRSLSASAKVVTLEVARVVASQITPLKIETSWHSSTKVMQMSYPENVSR